MGGAEEWHRCLPTHATCSGRGNNERHKGSSPYPATDCSIAKQLRPVLLLPLLPLLPACLPACPQVKENKRYAGNEGWTVSECAAKVGAEVGKIDILIHSLANGPEVQKPLLETSRRGYLAAMSASSYSFVSLMQVGG